MQIIIGVPGPWADRDELREAVQGQAKAKAGPLYILAGPVLMNRNTEQICRIELHHHKQSMADCFERMHSLEGVSQAELRLAQSHKTIVYLFAEGGSIDLATSAAEAASFLLNCGGSGVHIVTSGRSHTPSLWRELVDPVNAALIQAYVLPTIGTKWDGEFYSCGMHNFGMYDVVIEGSNFQHATKVVWMFLGMLYWDQPKIEQGHTFSTSPTSDLYRIYKCEPQPCERFEHLENPYGVWRLRLELKREGPVARR